MKKYMKSMILLVAIVLFFASCAPQPTPGDALPNDVAVDNQANSVDDQVNSAANNEQTSDTTNPSDKGMSIVYFDFDQFNLTAENMEIASSNADALSSNSASIKLEGNCDEWGSDEYNYALGLKRAKAVKNAIISNGIDAARISMVSYGESNPSCSEKSKSCWSQNRRVETKFLP
jgi:peptidoglycan-associated lipoprotein